MVLGWSLLKVGSPSWCTLLNCNLVLNCVSSSRRFSSQNYKIESVCLIGLACAFIHDFPLNRMAYYLRYVTGMKKVAGGDSLLQLVLTWPSWAYHVVKPYWTQALPCSSLARSLWLKMTSVSLTLTKCAPWALVTIDPYPCSLTSDFERLSFICFAK
jgi:hypothetical protein